MSDNLTISHEEQQNGGRYVATIANLEGVAQLTYQRAGDGVIIADHTGVPETMAKRGIAKALVRHAVADARDKGIWIIPHCSFVRAQALKHPEWSDVIQA